MARSGPVAQQDRAVFGAYRFYRFSIRLKYNKYFRYKSRYEFAQFSFRPREETLSPSDPCYCGSGLKYKKCHLLRD
ncbi:SEC-C metal-binding domain-containing protein [Rhizobium mongolense]|uniref:SEC-C metal-binding domain-containing protein n=1 Tax=Rhizobium mongolense TaxID=57676 RepID=UPI000A03A54F